VSGSARLSASHQVPLGAKVGVVCDNYLISGPSSCLPVCSRPPPALLPAVARGAVPASVLKALEATLERELPRSGALALSVRGTLARLQGTGSLERCDGEPACVGRLAGVLHISHVVLTTAELQAGGRVHCAVRLVDASGKVARQIEFEAADAAEVRSTLPALVPSLSPAATSKAEQASDLELVPLTKIPAPKTEPPPAPTAQMRPAAAPVVVTPSATLPSATAADRAGATATDRTGHGIPASPGVSRHLMAYTGAGVGALAVGLFAGGLYYYFASVHTYDEAMRRNADQSFVISNRDAGEQEKRRQTQLDRANSLFVLAGATAAIAGSLVALDLAWLSRPALAVEITAARASAQLSWAF
jgi:hypothetical protein